MILKATKIIGVGKCLPENIITNDDLSSIVDTNDEWISTRTGVRQRRIVNDKETATSLAISASLDALGFAGMDGKDMELIIVASSTPDYVFPSTACEIQSAIGASCPAFNITAACSGFVYALSVADSFIKSGAYKRVLVVGTEVHSRFIDWEDRNTCVLFGDGAGAMVLEAGDDENEILSIEISADGKKGMELKLPVSGSSNCPFNNKEASNPYIWMNGKEIYKFAVTTVPKAIKSALALANVDISKLDYLVPHHANMRIIDSVKERLNLKDEQIIVSLENYANTSTASVPIALTEAVEQNKIEDGSIIALCGFGGGLTWGTAIIKWHARDKRK